MTSRRLAAVPVPRRRVVLYVRVSAVMGREDLHSPDLQLAAMRELVRRQKLTETHVVQDIDVSGRTFSRTGISEVRRLAERGEVDVVAVYNLSRLGRNTGDSLRFISDLRQLGVAIVSTVEQIDDSPEGQFMLGQFLGMAQLYSDQLGRQWADTATFLARAGYLHGKVPLGYRRVPPRAVAVDEDTAPLVQRIFELYDGGVSFAGIAREVGPLLGARTRPTTIREILSNPVYVGKVRLRGEVYDGQHPPLVDERRWRRVQQRLQRPRLPSRTVQATHALAGLAKCGQHGCGLTLVRKPGRTRDGGRRVALVCGGMEGGHCVGIGAPDEEQVLEVVLARLGDLATLLKVDEGARLERKRARAAVRSREQALRGEVAKAEKQIDRLTMKLAEDTITDHAYAAAVKTLEEKRTRLLVDLAAAMDAGEAPATVTVAQVERIRRAWPGMSGAQRNRVLRTLVEAVWLDPPAKRGQPVGERLRVAWL